MRVLLSRLFSFFEKVEDSMSGESDISIAVKWRMEHELIVGLCQNVIKAYMANNRMQIKSNLKKLNYALTDHFLEEDTQLYSVCKQDLLTDTIIKDMNDYREKYRDNKVRILSNLSIYALPDKALDEVFFEGFNSIYAELMDLFKIEETSLYIHMEEQCICQRTMIVNEVVED